jgi:peptidoglycan/xylan/chitin deacetylase (PgdA/CDA1 family)
LGRLACAFVGVCAVLAGCTIADGPIAVVPAFSPTITYDHGEVRRVPSATGCVALTFDDGPHPTFTPALLRILAEEGAVATFFVVGSRVQQWPEITAAIHQAGNEIGNHSWSHPQLTQLSSDSVRLEIARTDSAVLAATGVTPAIIRLPYDANSPRVLSLMDRPVIFWDVDTLDWSNHSPSEIDRIIISRAHSGSIILLHDIHSTTIAAVRPVIRALKDEGYVFVTVSRLLTGRPCR